MTVDVRVLLADDHAAVRSTVRADLEEAGFVVCGEAEDAENAVRIALRERPDVCLLDIKMPGNGLVAAWDITSQLPSTKVLMLTMSNSEDHMVAALRAGAAGYILKDVEGPRLAAQIRACLGGELTINSAVARRMLELAPERSGGRGLLRKRREPDGFTTTPSDRELLAHLRDGLSSAETADRLGIPEAAVISAIADAVTRLRYADRAALVALSSLNA